MAAILGIVACIGLFLLISYIHVKLLVPHNFILYTFNSPVSHLIILFLWLYFILALFPNSRRSFVERMKKSRWFFYGFILGNLLLIYALIFDVSVLSHNRIDNYTFLAPQGKTYPYSDIVKIETGVNAREKWLPIISRRKGDFYYILTLKDGATIDLTDTHGTPGYSDSYQIFSELDKVFVNRGIIKISNPESFQFLDKHIGKIYRDRIQSILNNK